MDIKELEAKYRELLDYVNRITHIKLREAMKQIFTEKKEAILSRAGAPDRMEEGVYVPGNHHFFKGGLLFHLLETVQYAVSIALASGKEINMDVLICGALLHDIGKTITYEKWDNQRALKCPFTIYAKKVQHSYLGIRIAFQYLDENISEDVKLEIEHIIASHMSKNNKLANGAFVQPNTIEAKIVSEADLLSCMLSSYK